MKRLAGAAAVLLIAGTWACGPSDDPAPDAAGRPALPSAPEEVDSAEIERLRALPYVGVAAPLPPGAEVGVLRHDRERARPGLNIFTNAHFCSTQLMDMEGTILHSWSYEPCHLWDNTVLLPSGDLLAVGRVPHERSPEANRAARYLLRLGWDGGLRWIRRLPAHHDVELTPAGRILTLTERARLIPEVDPGIPVSDHAWALLSPAGDLLEEVSLADVLLGSPRFAASPGRTRREEIDLFHANSVEWMRQPGLIGRDPLFGPDHVLTCIRNQDTIAILSWGTRELIWSWGRGELASPHDATLTPGGTILVFDNGLGRNWSRVVEVDPVARSIVWEYRAPDPASFFSPTRGACQRLGDGNTLITESETGRAFEVTPGGEIVWEFLNSNLTAKREPSAIVRMRRYEGLEYADLVRRIAGGGGSPAPVD